MSGIKFTGDWSKAKKVLASVGNPTTMKRVVAMAVMQEAHFFAGKVKEHISDPANFKPLSPLTLKMRALAGFGGTKPLNRSGDLKNSVSVTPKTPSLKHFVGVLRKAKGVNIADVMENGATIVLEMTPKMRRFLFGVLLKGEPKQGGGGGGSGIIVIKIPARPFIAPVFAKWGPTSGERMMARLAKLLNGALGTP